MKYLLNLRRTLCVCLVLIFLAACGEDEVTNIDGGGGDGPATLANRIERNNEFALKL